MPAGYSESTGAADSGLDLPCATCPYRGTGRCLDPCGLRSRLFNLPRTAVPLLRAVAAEVVDQIAVHIQQEIPAYAGPAHGRRRGLILDAVGRAVADFVCLVDGSPGDHSAVDELFRRMGAGLAREGGGPASLLSALQLASSDVLRAIEEAVRRHEQPGEVIAAVARGLSDYLRHLSEQVERGYLGARVARLDPRGRLVRAVLRGEPAGTIERLARTTSWTPPARVIALVADLHGQKPKVDLIRSETRLLVEVEQDGLVVVAPELTRRAAEDALVRVASGVVVAVSWPVQLVETAHAVRWARRALRLHREGRIPREMRIIDCAEIRLALWLEADPPLVEQVSMELLTPLLAEKPHQRLVLAETLLRWLETAETAPALAEHLDVHVNTVHNRLHRLQEMFGDRLVEPKDRLALVLAVNAALPHWRAVRRR